ncbi:endoplasmic reticulum lectin 1 isoform X2 [Diachasma alloeum]|uniref:endoplasmic reticulum lectin 1 isoform X2 n=1 Tax=Diachasma alloeum TaxID=454923 RepID=UPI000738485F|nr:endoplasmic reticulum lectin 1 isoform X2 [Diachasma alloeum]
MRRTSRLGFLVICQVLFLVECLEFSARDADVLYKIIWPGKISTDLLTQDNLEQYPITTANNEKYTCMIPVAKKQEKNSDEPYTGPNPIELLAPLFNQNICSFKLETYWTYEVCHGRHVRQYHEEREGKKVKVQEFYLGRFPKGQKEKLSSEYDELAKNPDKKSAIPTKKFDGIQMPYVEIEMTDGTICDLSNKPRTIKLLYVCHQQGKHEILSLEETSSCEYEAIVLSPFICSHPDYGPRGGGEDEINCVPQDKAPKRPRALAALEAESLKLRHQKVMDEKPQKVYRIFRIVTDGQDGEPRGRVEIHAADSLDKNTEDLLGSMIDMNQGQTSGDVTPVQSFLSGKHCLNGGNGWWKYEFCYGKSVMQYHVERDGSKTMVDLGKFDKQKHIEWMEAHPQKRPKPVGQRQQLSHFYSEGSVCDKTGKLRQTEVRLKCVESTSASPSSVSLFLLEPKTCEYILGVESPLICKILDYADNNGLILDAATVNFDDLKATSGETLQKPDDSEPRKIIHDEH